MRARTGCQPCRERHIKCVRKTEADRCEKCEESRRECFDTSVYRFKPVRTVHRERKATQSRQRHLACDPAQIWVDVPPSLDFVHAGGHGAVADEDPSFATSEETAPIARSDLNDGTTELSKNTPGSSQARPIEQPLSTEYEAGQQGETEQYHSTRQLAVFGGSYESDQPLENSSAQPGQASSNMRLHFSPEIGMMSFETLHHTTATGTAHHSSSAAQSTSPHSSLRPGILGTTPTNQLSPMYNLSVAWPFRTDREAKLFYHYIKRISPWIDVVDSSSHFGIELPRRAAHQPLIANAIYAISALHLSLLENTDDRESPQYVDECLQHLRQILEDPLGHSDENLLAGVILLRSHEEISDKDNNVHLLGGQRLLNSIASYAADGGFKESASWISLRQHVYISLTQQSRLGLNLSNYEHSRVFIDNTDEAWANRAIFLLACVLNYAFGPENETSPQEHTSAFDRWAELEARVEDWARTKPWYFSPLWTHSTPHEKQPGALWPEILTSHPAHAIGLQYYAICKIVLTIYDPRLGKLGFGSHRLRKAAEATVLQNMRIIIGIAVSNPDVTNAMFQSSHILACCGSYLHDPKDQAAVVDLLTSIQQTMGWRTKAIVETLREQWET